MSLQRLALPATNNEECENLFFARCVVQPSSSAVKKTERKYSHGVVMYSGYEKSPFSTYISLYIANDTRRAHSYNRRRIGTRMRSNAAIFNDLE